MNGRVLVVGSINVDVSVTCARLPQAGETVLADSVHRSGGGKGANQAVGAARAGGAATTLIGAVGDDADGDGHARASCRRAGVDCRRVARSASLPTGLALITVDAAAENTIVVAAGANAAVEVTEADRGAIEAADVILAQLEIPQATVVAAARGRRPGVPLILNAAPSAPLSAELAAEVDLLVVNEHEARDLSGLRATSRRRPPTCSTQVPAVLVTLGAAGRPAAPARRTRLCRPGTEGRGGRHGGRRRHLLRRPRSRARPGRERPGRDAARLGGRLAGRAAAGRPELGPDRSTRPARRPTPPTARTDRWMTTSTPWSPDRSTDRRAVPLEPGADLTVLDTGKILAAPDDPARWPPGARRSPAGAPRPASGTATTTRSIAAPSSRWAAACFVVSPGLAVGRAALRLGDPPVHARAAARRRARAVRRVRRGRAVARLPGHRHRRPQPVGLLPRHRRARTTWSKTLHDNGVRVFVDYNPWDVGTRRSGDDAAELAALVADFEIDGVFLDTLKEGGGRRCSTGSTPPGPASPSRASRRVALRAARRPPAVVGSVVRRLTRPRRRPLALLRAPAPDAPRAALAP